MSAAENLTSLDLYRAAFDLEMELTEREGVTDDDLDARLNDVLGSTADKLDGHRYYINHFNGRAETVRKEARRLEQRARQLENTSKRIKRHAMLVMDARVKLLGPEQGRKVATDHGIVYTQTSRRLVIEDEGAFINTYRDTEWVTLKPHINRQDLTRALKSNAEVVEGVHMAETVTVVFK